MLIIGVDPGSHTTGYGLVDDAGGRLTLVDVGVLKAPKAASLPQRLRIIHTGLVELLDRHEPEAMAVEDVFNARNARSSLILGQARGALLLAGALRDLPIAEYAPREVKMALTGNGAATKEQLRFMVGRLLRLQKVPDSLDASDALGVALCHSLRRGTPTGPATTGGAGS